MTHGLSWEEFLWQTWECGIATGICVGKLEPTAIVIRTETGDHHVAAVHLDGSTLVIDMGHMVLGQITKKNIDWARQVLKDQQQKKVEP